MIKKVCLGVLCLALAFVTIAAAEPETGRSRHDRELMFGVRGLDSIGLTSYGGELGLRYFLAERFAVRPGFAISNNDHTSSPYDDGYTDYVQSSDEYTFSLVFERYMEPRDRLLPYWGLGVSYDTSEAENSGGYPEEPAEGTTLSRTITYDTWSALGLLGVQWRWTDSFRLGAEYKLRYYRRENEEKTERYGVEPRINTGDTEGFSSYTSSLYLAVLF